MQEKLKFHDTLNIERVEAEYVDLTFYDSALGTSSLRDFDYYLSRVSNNPSVSRSVVTHEVNKSMYPKTSTVVASFSESSMETGEREVINNSHYDTAEKADPLRSTALKHIVDETVAVILRDHPSNKTGLLKMFAYFLTLSGASERVGNPILRRFIHELRKYEDLPFKMMHEYSGSAYAAKRDREVFRKIFSAVTQSGK